MIFALNSQLRLQESQLRQQISRLQPQCQGQVQREPVEHQ